jgi:hypothetical protein
MKDLSSSLKSVINRNRVVRRLVELLFVFSLLQLVACGYSAPSTSGASGTTTVNGTVNSVALTSVNNGTGGLTNATAVVLTAPLGMNSLLLCGDQRSSFPANTAVQVSYTSGTYCSNLVSVNPL